jgi:hypothetical protein
MPLDVVFMDFDLQPEADGYSEDKDETGNENDLEYQ